MDRSDTQPNRPVQYSDWKTSANKLATCARSSLFAGRTSTRLVSITQFVKVKQRAGEARFVLPVLHINRRDTRTLDASPMLVRIGCCRTLVWRMLNLLWTEESQHPKCDEVLANCCRDGVHRILQAMVGSDITAHWPVLRPRTHHSAPPLSVGYLRLLRWYFGGACINSTCSHDDFVMDIPVLVNRDFRNGPLYPPPPHLPSGR
jgi:hypothetical protein